MLYVKPWVVIERWNFEILFSEKEKFKLIDFPVGRGVLIDPDIWQ